MISHSVLRLAFVASLSLAMLLGAAGPAHAQTVVGTVGVGAMPQGVAVNPITNRIYVPNSGSNNVTVIDGSNNAVIATVGVGTGPQGIAVNAATNRIYVANLGSSNVSVIDGVSNAVVATVGVGDRPISVAANPITNRIYVANGAGNSVSVIDGTTNSVVATIPFQGGPVGLAVNPVTNRLYVVTAGAAGVLSVIDGASNAVIATLPSGSNSSGVAVNPVTNRFYVTNTMIGNVTVFDGATNTMLQIITLGTPPIGTSGIDVNPTLNHIYVASFSPGTNNLFVIDGATNAAIATIAGIGGSVSVAANPTTSRVYVPDPQKNIVSVLQDAAPAGLPGTGGVTVPLLPISLAGALLLILGLAIRGMAGRLALP